MSCSSFPKAMGISAAEMGLLCFWLSHFLYLLAFVHFMNSPNLISPDALLSILFQSPNATAVYQSEDIVILSANAAMLKIWGKDRTVVGLL